MNTKTIEAREKAWEMMKLMETVCKVHAKLRVKAYSQEIGLCRQVGSVPSQDGTLVRGRDL